MCVCVCVTKRTTYLVEFRCDPKLHLFLLGHPDARVKDVQVRLQPLGDVEVAGWQRALLVDVLGCVEHRLPQHRHALRVFRTFRTTDLQRVFRPIYTALRPTLERQCLLEFLDLLGEHRVLNRQPTLEEFHLLGAIK